MSENHRWYVIHVYSGFESKIVESIMEQAEKKGIAEQFSELMVPAEEVVESPPRQEVQRRSASSSRVTSWLKMELSDAAWNLVKNTQRVTGFLGGQGRPVPISEREAKQIMQSMAGRRRKAAAVDHLRDRGERSRDGWSLHVVSLAWVEEVDLEKARLKVAVIDLWPRNAGGAGLQPGGKGLSDLSLQRHLNALARLPRGGVFDSMLSIWLHQRKRPRTRRCGAFLRLGARCA